MKAKIAILFLLLSFAQKSKEGVNNSDQETLALVDFDEQEQDHSTIIKNISPKREFRAAWITTFSNLDWPSSNSLTSAQQKAEFIDLLNLFEAANINAVIVQVRAAADAFYPSKYAPWSAWLTGEQGKSPKPYYDPLAFMIEECHKRNMEFHAWFNPYRAVSHTRFSNVAAFHISNHKKDWFFTYGDTKYFNPGVPEVQDHIVAVIQEVLQNYNVDGIHLDDYFYPYTIKNQEIPDALTYDMFCKDSTLSIQEWRRENINQLIQLVAKEVKKTKPYVKFGVSPYAIWRNKKQDPLGSETNSGQTSFDNLYCDTKLWLENGWLDYIAPQLYWSTSNPYANYQNLIDWWTFNNKAKRHLYIGHAIYKLDVRNKHTFATTELLDQIQISRTKKEIHGNVYFRADAFKKNYQNFVEEFNTGIYKYPAIPPRMPWIDSIPPKAPKYLKRKLVMDEFIQLRWEQAKSSVAEDTAHYYIVYATSFKPSTVHDLKAENMVSVQKENKFTTLLNPNKNKYFTVTALDRLHNESTELKTVYIP